MRAFYSAILAGGPAEGVAPYPTLADGVRAVDLVEAVVTSAEQRTWVEVGPT
jgi:predicted dehydrogenase